MDNNITFSKKLKMPKVLNRMFDLTNLNLETETNNLFLYP